MYVSLILRRLDLFTRPLRQNGNSRTQFATVVQHSRRIWHHHLFLTTHHLIRSPSHPQLTTRALPLMALMAWCRMIFVITSWLLLIHIVTSHRQLHPKLCSQTSIFLSIGCHKKFYTLISIRWSWTRISVLHFYQTRMCRVTSVVEDWLVPCLEINVTWVMKDGGIITCTRSEPPSLSRSTKHMQGCHCCNWSSIFTVWYHAIMFKRVELHMIYTANPRWSPLNLPRVISTPEEYRSSKFWNNDLWIQRATGVGLIFFPNLL